MIAALDRMRKRPAPIRREKRRPRSSGCTGAPLEKSAAAHGKSRFESIFFLNADEAAAVPYDAYARHARNGDEAMTNRPPHPAQAKPLRIACADRPVKDPGRSVQAHPSDKGRKPSTARRMALLGEEFIACSAMLAALGNECRQAIFLDLLRNWGGLRTCEIAEHVGLSKPAVSRHLGIMEKAGIVTMKRVGTVRIYHPSESTKPWMALSQLAWNAYRFVDDEISAKARPESCARAHLGAGKDDSWI